jgi:PPOX class probable F420-dependent enzyme
MEKLVITPNVVSNRIAMKPLPDPVKALIEAKTYANVATLMPDGSPHVVQTWVDHDGDLVLINTNEGSQKHKNAMRNPKVALDVCDPASPYHVAVIRGRVKEVTFDGADEHIDKLARKYLGQDRYQNRIPGRRRVLIKIEPTRVIAPFMDNPRWKAWNTESK